MIPKIFEELVCSSDIDDLHRMKDRIEREIHLESCVTDYEAEE